MRGVLLYVGEKLSDTGEKKTGWTEGSRTRVYKVGTGSLSIIWFCKLKLSPWFFPNSSLRWLCGGNENLDGISSPMTSLVLTRESAVSRCTLPSSPKSLETIFGARLDRDHLHQLKIQSLETVRVAGGRFPLLEFKANTPVMTRGWAEKRITHPVVAPERLVEVLFT